jgi:hypothetical protein
MVRMRLNGVKKIAWFAVTNNNAIAWGWRRKLLIES